MTKRAPTRTIGPITEPDRMFEMAAELFSVLSAPMRLRIIRSVCDAEKNVTELLSEIKTTQPNMSQHLNTLYKAGVLGKRREGVQIYYRVIDPRVTDLCHAVCAHVTDDQTAKLRAVELSV
ncbi:MAG: metalloregulator ArsR/SmtB family transcription factor [Rhodoferax sp.]|nr:metalloregulator ArsR/SmtB family transcription factor [Rhodoferax sp.]